MKDDFVQLWNARAAQDDEGARGNFLFVMLLQEMTLFGEQVCGQPLNSIMPGKYINLISFLVNVLKPGAMYRRMEDGSAFGFNGPMPGRLFGVEDGRPHMQVENDYIRVDLRKYFEDLVAVVDPYMQGAADGV